MWKIIVNISGNTKKYSLIRYLFLKDLKYMYGFIILLAYNLMYIKEQFESKILMK